MRPASPASKQEILLVFCVRYCWVCYWMLSCDCASVCSSAYISVIVYEKFVNVISYKPLMGISPNLWPTYSWGQSWTGQILRLKLKRSKLKVTARPSVIRVCNKLLVPNVTRFTTWVQLGRKVNWLDWRWEVRVTRRSYTVRNHLFRNAPFRYAGWCLDRCWLKAHHVNGLTYFNT